MNPHNIPVRSLLRPIGVPGVETFIADITPDLAMALLERNVNIRHMRQALLQHYSAEMSAKQWEFNGETIKFDKNGKLIDGQHRLTACVQSGQTIRVLIVIGVTGRGVDEGRRRSYSDLLGGQNQTDANVLAAVVRLLYLMSIGKDPYKHTARVSNATLGDYYETLDHERLAVAQECTLRCRRILTPTVVCAIVYLASQTPETQELVTEFFDGIAKGANLREGSAQLALRRFVEGQSAVKGAAGWAWRRAMFIAYARAWNAYITGVPVVNNQRIWSKLHETDIPTILSVNSGS